MSEYLLNNSIMLLPIPTLSCRRAIKELIAFLWYENSLIESRHRLSWKRARKGFTGATNLIVDPWRYIISHGKLDKLCLSKGWMIA